jgi:hypothetical protein
MRWSHRVDIATATGVGRYWQGGPAFPDRWIVCEFKSAAMRRITKGKEKSMKLLTASAFAVGLSLMAMSASRAMPLAPLDQSVSSDTVRVAGGCGPGWHRGPYGGCRPMYNCPPGWHSGPFGRHCFRNW